jgi:hypothetical protein
MRTIYNLSHKFKCSENFLDYYDAGFPLCLCLLKGVFPPFIRMVLLLYIIGLTHVKSRKFDKIDKNESKVSPICGKMQKPAEECISKKSW